MGKFHSPLACCEWFERQLALTNFMHRAQASILVLLELREQCPEVFDKLEVYIDGGFERGSDILKAIALGATAVGVGRPFLYSLVYGQEGVEHLAQSKLNVFHTSQGYFQADSNVTSSPERRDRDVNATLWYHELKPSIASNGEHSGCGLHGHVRGAIATEEASQEAAIEVVNTEDTEDSVNSISYHTHSIENSYQQQIFH